MLIPFEQAIYERNYHPQDLPADQITHINYAFADVRANGEVFVATSLNPNTAANPHKQLPN